MIKSHYISLLYPFKSRIVKHFLENKKKISQKYFPALLQKKHVLMLYAMYISENNTSKFNSRNIFVESIFKGFRCYVQNGKPLTHPS